MVRAQQAVLQIHDNIDTARSQCWYDATRKIKQNLTKQMF